VQYSVTCQSVLQGLAKSSVFSLLRKTDSDGDACTDFIRMFQADKAAAGNLRHGCQRYTARAWSDELWRAGGAQSSTCVEVWEALMMLTVWLEIIWRWAETTMLLSQCSVFSVHPSSVDVADHCGK